MTDLFSELTLGAITLPNRIIMAPMTRSRADAQGVHGELAVTHYQQRASAGLIISEGTQPSLQGQGYCRTPGIHAPNQIEAWRQVASAVSSAGGRMVMQLMHVGRIASTHNKHGAETVAPSAIQAAGQMYTDSHGMVDFDQPTALTPAGIGAVIDDYVNAANNAMAAGFEGVELHATSGYLPAQFLASGSNQRDDAYGGSIAGRIRFVVELLEALSGAVGADRVGLRICPGNPFNDLKDEEPEQTFSALLTAIAPLGLAYLHVIRLKKSPVDNPALGRRLFNGPLIVNDSFDGDEAAAWIADGRADAVSFARHFIGNPDLVERLTSGAPLAGFDHRTLYTPGAKGYVDYPTLAEAG